MREIIKRPSHIAITEYDIGDNRKLENAYIYTKNWVKKPIGICYDRDSRELRIFGGASQYFISQLCNNELNIKEENLFDPYDNISLRFQNFPRDHLQIDMIQFLIGGGEWAANKNCTQIASSAETGEGKTFCATAMITYLRVKTIIIVICI